MIINNRRRRRRIPMASHMATKRLPNRELNTTNRTLMNLRLNLITTIKNTISGDGEFGLPMRCSVAAESLKGGEFTITGFANENSWGMMEIGNNRGMGHW
ncbi:hypothetical protein IC582_026172 [Cucumis melo]